MDHEALALAARLARNIRSLRRARGWTQADLAERTDLSPHYIAILEAGQRLPTLTTLLLFAREFAVPADRLIASPPTNEDWIQQVHDLAEAAPQSARGFIVGVLRLGIEAFTKARSRSEPSPTEKRRSRASKTRRLPRP